MAYEPRRGRRHGEHEHAEVAAKAGAGACGQGGVERGAGPGRQDIGRIALDGGGEGDILGLGGHGLGGEAGVAQGALAGARAAKVVDDGWSGVAGARRGAGASWRSLGRRALGGDRGRRFCRLLRAVDAELVHFGRRQLLMRHGFVDEGLDLRRRCGHNRRRLGQSRARRQRGHNKHQQGQQQDA